MKKKIFMSVFTLMLGFVFTLTTNNVQAAKTYDYEGMSITIPDYFDEWNENVINEKLNIEFRSQEDDTLNVGYSKVTNELIRKRPITEEKIKEEVEYINSLNSVGENYLYKQEVLASELIYIDGVPASKIRYKYTCINSNNEYIAFYEKYSIVTDKYTYWINIQLRNGKESYLDTDSFKNMINSIDIKGVVTENLPEYETFENKYISITLPSKYISSATNLNIDDSKTESNSQVFDFYILEWEKAQQDNKTINCQCILEPNTNLKEYTIADLNKRVQELDDKDKNNDTYSVDYKIIDKKLIYIDGVGAMKIRYSVNYSTNNHNSDASYYFEEYTVRTDNAVYKFEQNGYEKESYLDSTEFKNMINSIKIKDSVKTTIPFKDVNKNSWYYSAVKHCYTNKYINGTNSYTFAPNTKLTRGMLVTILYGMEGSPKVTATNKFSDVKSSKYYYNAVLWASSKGIVNGSNGKFRPDDNITRQDLAVILSAYAMYKGKYVKSNYGLSKYPDSSKISSYALASMRWAVKNKIINGTNGKLNPKGTATRAEAATMLYSYYLNIK